MLINKYNVDDRLIRGSRPITYRDVRSLKREGVSQIVCVETKPYLIEQLACKLNGIKFVRHKIDLLGGKFFTMKDYKSITKEIKENVGKTYIHCSRGLHRTAECVAAYNILSKKKEPKDALKEDMLGKKYFEKRYALENNVIKKGDGLFSRLLKKRRTRIGTVVEKSYKNFLKMFKL